MLITTTGKDGVYYEGEATYGFQVQNGQFVCVEEYPLIGSEYDGSGY